MPKPALDTNRATVVARLEQEGRVVRHGGDHDVFKRPERPGRIVVPRHRVLFFGCRANHRKDRRMDRLR